MGIAESVIKRADALKSARSVWESEWADIADYCLPTQSKAMEFARNGSQSYDWVADGPASRSASRKRFDSTAIWAIDRLTAGMESLSIPQNEKWHGLAIDNPLGPEMTDEEEKWAERLRDYQFAVRYDPRAGFHTATQKALRSCIAFGTGVTFTEESYGQQGADARRVPFVYRYIPLSQCLLSLNAEGNCDTNIRVYSMTARQLVQKFGDKVSSKVKKDAESDRDAERPSAIIHAVMPREEMGSSHVPGSVRNSGFMSVYVERDTKQLLGEGGFFEFPYNVFYWTQFDDSAYGESPVMLGIDDIRGLNVMRRAQLRAGQQWVSPPLAVANDGVMNRPNLNPQAINPGAIDENGRLKIQPIITGQNPAIAADMIERERQGIRETLYINLFQILVNNPSMTATEAMIRANEKGELLGPAGAKIQAALANQIEREIAILDRKGAFSQGGSLEAPESLDQGSISVRFTSPLDRLRQAKEGEGVMKTYQFAAQIAAAKGTPEVFDNFDDDESVDLVARVFGAPMKIKRDDKERDAMRQQRAQAMEQARQLEMAKGVAEAANNSTAPAELLASMGQQNVAPLPLPPLAPAGQ